MNCEGCRFFSAAEAADSAGARPCRRFPEVAMKKPTEWCGEHREREAAKASKKQQNTRGVAQAPKVA